jgi:hypothetical protein
MRFAHLGQYLRSGSSAASSWSSAGRAEHRCFMLVFASQGIRYLPQCVHTFATFVRAGDAPELECQTISWLPEDLNIKILRLWPQPGRNLSLDETVTLAKAKDARLLLWGPYRIDQELYERAKRQVERLNVGHVQYKAIDLGFRPDTATNCFHAVSDIDADFGLLRTGTAFGPAASALVAAHLRRWIIEPNGVHPWLIERLGLDPSTIETQQLLRTDNEVLAEVRT